MLERMAYLERLRELRRLKEAGGELPEWRQQAARRDAAAEAAANPQPLLSFTPSVDLNELARPADRWAGLDRRTTMVGCGARPADARKANVSLCPAWHSLSHECPHLCP